MTEDEVEKLDMNKKPKQEVAIFGLGVLFNKIDKLIEKMDRISKMLYFMEQRQQKIAELEHPELKRDN